MKKNILLTVIFLAISNLVIAQSYGVASSVKADSAAVLKTRNAIKSLMDKANIPGLSIAVGKDGQIIYSEGFGISDIENGELMRPSTKLRIGSISKSLTAALLMKMYEDKLIELDAPIKSYLTSISKPYAEITPRQLAGHLGGVRHYREGEYFRTEQYDNVKESLEIFINDSLLYKPGTKYSYSTYGYVLQSAVLEEAADKPFLQLMRNKLFNPLSMNSTVAEFADSIIYHRAEFYNESNDGNLLNAPSENYSYKWAGGGYLSTAEDLANFGMKLMNGRYLKKDNVNLMFQSQTTASGEKTGYGIGWEIDKDWEERPIVKHGGSSMGARAFMMLYPNHNLVIVMLSNKGRAPIFEGEAGVIADYFLDGDDSAVEQEIEGSYKYKRVVDEKEQEGIITLIKSGNSYKGMISNFYSPTADILNVQKYKENIVISVVTSSGIANLWLQFSGNGLRGQYGWDSPSQKISGEKINPK